MATARKLPSGKWRVRIYVGKDANGKLIYESFTGNTKRETERQAMLYDGGRKRREEERKAGKVTLDEAMQDYISTCEAVGESPATVRGYHTIRRSYASLHNIYLTDLRARDVQNIVNEWASKLSPKTIANRYSFLMSVMEANNLKPDFSSVKRPEKDDKEMVIPDDEDVRRLLAKYLDVKPDMYLAVLLASTLGLRRSEICALEWTDIDFDSATISITKALVPDKNNVYQLKKPKTKAGKRVLTVSDSVMNELRYYRNMNGRVVKISPSAITSEYVRARKKYNVPGRFHDLRHYAASIMLALNVPDKYAIKIMGHATTNMLHRVYQHTIAEKEESIYKAINGHTDDLLSDRKINY